MPLQGRLSEWEKKIIFLVVLLLIVEYADTINELSLEHAFATCFATLSSVLSASYDHSFMGRHLNSDDYDFVLNLMMATVDTI